jgi:hypothetical protein
MKLTPQVGEMEVPMRKRIVFIPVFALFLLLMSACSIRIIDQNDQTRPPATSSGSQHTSNVVTQQPEPLDNSPRPTLAPATPAATSTPAPTATPAPAPAQLPQTEIDFFTEYFGMDENNGFLLSNYDTPEYIDLFEVFYAGAGLMQDTLSDAEILDYLNIIGESELYTDLLKLTTAQLDAFLLKKTGLRLNEFAFGLPYLYIEEYDAYYLQRGDTNYNFVECVGGYKTGDGIYVIQLAAAGDYGQYIESCTVTLKKNGNDYLFLSNSVLFSY